MSDAAIKLAAIERAIIAYCEELKPIAYSVNAPPAYMVIDRMKEILNAR